MELKDESIETESIPISFAVPMALMEQKGVRKLIDKETRKIDDSCLKLSAGMAIKAMCGILFSCYSYSSLCRAKQLYELVPVDKIFGSHVEQRTLSDTNIGRRMDAISALDLGELSWNCHELIHGDTEYEYFVIFLDGTNYTVYGIGYDRPNRRGGTQPKYGGNAKDGHNDRLQKNLISMTDKEGRLMCSLPFDGNVSDVTMDKKAIEFLKSKLDCGRTTIVADSKLATTTILPGLYESDLGFVTKMPLNFNEKAHERVVLSAINGSMDRSKDHPGMEVYDTHEDLCGHDLRLIAFRFDKDINESRDYLRSAGFNEMKKRAISFKRRRFHCEEDVRKAFSDLMMSSESYAYDAVLRIDTDPKAKKGEPNYFGRVSGVRINEGRFEEAAERFSIKVLGTNIPFSETDENNPREGRTAFGIVDLYLKQDRAEKNFRRMKTEFGMDVGRLHKTNRLDVKQFTCAVCIMLMNEMDTRLTQSLQMTWEDFRFKFVNNDIIYDRKNETMQLIGKKGVTAEFIEALDAIGIEQRFLLGY